MKAEKKAKIARLKAALSTQTSDRVPVSDAFWTGFRIRCQEAWGADVDLYRKFDLDYVIVNPNMDPVIGDFEVLKQEGDDITVLTGFGATIRRSGDIPMPHFEKFSVNEPEEMQDYILEAGNDPRRLYREGSDQINCLGDAISFHVPSWNDRVESYHEDIPVFGSVCEGYEFLWRCIGTENSLMWSIMEPEMFGDFVKRIGDFLVDLAKFQISESKGRLSGMYIWGDVAYKNGMMFSPETWRAHFKPIVKQIIDVCHEAGLMVIYHGCGDATAIYEDFIEIGLDGYNPLEVKAGLDIVKLKPIYGDRLCFVGNIDVRELESGDRNRIKREVLYKLSSAEHGGWICQSDHSVSSEVEPESYAYMVELVREYGVFPLDMTKINRELEELNKLI